jgi:hypothetical protein
MCGTSVATNPVPAVTDSNTSVVAAQIEIDDDRTVLTEKHPRTRPDLCPAPPRKVSLR